MSQEPIITIRHLHKSYQTQERVGLFRSRPKEVVALQDVSLDLYPGESFGLLGPNGAGKTTLIKCLTTLLLPTSGEVRVNGYTLGRQDAEIRASLGCMLMGERGLYWKLTGRENLEYFGALYHLPPARRRARVKELVTLLALGDIADRAVETYSSGQRMKLAFARALVHEAPLLILDEPTVTLDVPTARELRGIVRDLHRQGHTILYTTHQMAEAEELCHRVAILDRGQVLAVGSVEELKATIRQQSTIRLEGVIPARAYEAARNLEGVLHAALIQEQGVARLTLLTNDVRALLPALLHTLLEHGATLEYLSPGDITLEDVFLAKTGRALSEDTRQR